MSRFDAVTAAYDLLVEKELAGIAVTQDELCAATGWKPGTARTYLSKKWPRFVEKSAGGWLVRGVAALSEQQFLKYMSQVASRQEAAFVEEFPPRVEALLAKAIQAATLALDGYNRPATAFRTEGFSVLMVVAWTALFHAIFELGEVDYTYKDKEGRPILADGEPKAWELAECARAHFRGEDDPVRRNIEFMVLLRNKIEHRFVPELDLHVAGECQAMLLNFERTLTTTFGDRFGLAQTLCAPLQPTTYRRPEQRQALKEFQAQQYDELRDFLEGYRSSLPEDVFGDPRFSFRVYLVPKVGNHLTSSDLAFEFVKYDPENAEAFREIEKRVVMTRERKVPVANQGKYRPAAVVKLVGERLGKRFTSNDHTQAWKAYAVRRSGPAFPDGCDQRFCQYDDAHIDYIYTDAWVDFLSKKLKDDDELDRVRKFR